MKNYLFKSISPLIWILVFPWSNAIADSVDDFGVWGAIQGQGSFTHSEMSKWQWWMEGQARWFNDASRLGQSIIRPGVGYKLSDQVSVWLGYAWIRTSPLEREQTDEHRIWQQRGDNNMLKGVTNDRF